MTDLFVELHIVGISAWFVFDLSRPWDLLLMCYRSLLQNVVFFRIHDRFQWRFVKSSVQITIVMLSKFLALKRYDALLSQKSQVHTRKWESRTTVDISGKLYELRVLRNNPVCMVQEDIIMVKYRGVAQLRNRFWLVKKRSKILIHLKP